MKKILNETTINNLIKYIFIIIFTIIFILLLFIDNSIEYNFINVHKIKNHVCLIIIFSLSLLFFLIKKYSNYKIFNNFKNIILKNDKLTIGILFFVLFILQVIILENIYFETEWDIYHVFNTANKFVNTGSFDGIDYFNNYPYFEVYPNNLTITFIFIYLIKLSNLIKFASSYKFLIIISILLVDLAGLFMLKTIKNFTQNKGYVIISAILFFFFIGLSPWFLIPYSDSYSILFPISILYFYTKKDKKIYDYILIGILIYLGYLIKPTVVIILIAIIILELTKLLFNNKIYINKYIFKNIFAVALGIMLVFTIHFDTKNNVVLFRSTKEYQFSLYHYIMMGLNTSTDGAFNADDVENSLMQNGYQGRIEYNKKTIKERINSLGVNGSLKHLVKKTLVNYNDGTFAWGKEGGFFKKVKKNNSKLSVFLKSIYYNNGNNFLIFGSIMHMLWLFILITSFIGAILKKANSKNNLIYLTIIGITLFTLIFESRARYLYLYSPYYIIAATMGIEAIYNKYKKNKQE